MGVGIAGSTGVAFSLYLLPDSPALGQWPTCHLLHEAFLSL